MENPSIIKSKPYRNWVRGALGLLYLHEGLQPFTNHVVQSEHSRILQRFGKCASCFPVGTIQPAHSYGKSCIQRNRFKCNCKIKTNKVCNICGKIYDEIIAQHRFDDPNWETDSSKWCCDHWQIAKCFLTATSKVSNNTATETDAAGLLSIIINGRFFQQELQCIIKPPIDTFSQARVIRNEILHNATLQLTDNELTRYLHVMVAVLEDKKTLVSDPAAKEAVVKLNEIMNNGLIITTADEAKAIEAALNEIKKARDESEESIRSLVEKKQKNIEEHTASSLASIETAKKQVTEEVEQSVSSTIGEKYEPDIKRLKTGHNDHENRLNALEGDMKSIQITLTTLEKQVSSLITIEQKHQERLRYLQMKQDLQKNLVKRYEKQYVKTWICPLKVQDNDINISEVYVTPKMVVEENSTYNHKESVSSISRHSKESSAPTKCAVTVVNRYQELFCTDDRINKKIFILGDVGAGKSAFCQMMIYNWCRSIIKSSNTPDTDMKSNADTTDHDAENINEIGKFEYLFYIPLRIMSLHNDICEMVKLHFNDLATAVNEVLEKESARCLILADGLDEWTSPIRTLHIPFLSAHGIPASNKIGDATVIITSRPSARGILNMKSTEYDQRLNILGVDEKSKYLLVQRYMKQCTKPSFPLTYPRILFSSELQHLERTPVLLQQIVWLHCNGFEIGKSTSDIYSSVINIIFGWSQKEEVTKCPEGIPNDVSHLRLPKYIEMYPRCKKNRTIILILGKIAFEKLTAASHSATIFGRSRLEEYCSTDDINIILNNGLLKEEKCYDPTFDNTQLLFIHTSFLEFFAAVFVASSCGPIPSVSTESVTDQHPLAQTTNLEKLFAACSSVADVLQLTNVIIMVCGLSPFLTTQLTQCIYEVVEHDEEMHSYRSSLTDKLYFCSDLSESLQIQSLIFRCLSECKLKGLHDLSEIRLGDVVINCEQSGETFAQHIAPDYVLSLYIVVGRKRFNLERSFETIARLTNLYSVKIELNTYQLSHRSCTILSSCLKKAVSLVHVSLEGIKCDQIECQGHNIDLSKHDELQTVSLVKCDFFINNTFSTELDVCTIKDCVLPHDEYSTLLISLAQIASLRQLVFEYNTCCHDACDGHHIDLSNHENLTTLWLDNCDNLRISSISSDKLVSCAICFCDLPHEQYTRLSASLTQSISLQELELVQLNCDEKECEGHTIDLFKHEQLRLIIVSFCESLSISSFNSSELQTFKATDCVMPHDQYATLLFSLEQAISLKTLALDNILCNNEACNSHSIDLTKHTHLHDLKIEECGRLIISSINSAELNSCKITNCVIRHKHHASFSSSLTSSTSLSKLKLECNECDDAECEGHSIDVSTYVDLYKLTLEKCDGLHVSMFNFSNLSTCTIRDCVLKNENCANLASSLMLAVHLEQLSLVCIKCVQPQCEGNNIDLSKNRNLHNLTLDACEHLWVSSVNSVPLQSCTIRNCVLSHSHYKLLSSVLTQATCIRELVIDNLKCSQDECDGHVIDLSKHEHLQKFTLEHCEHMPVSMGISVPLQSCSIRSCVLQHAHYTSLVSDLTQALSISELVLDNIKCKRDGCKDHEINFSTHKQLQNVQFVNTEYALFSTVNITNIENFHIDCPTLLDLKFLEYAPKIHRIDIVTSLYTKVMNATIQTLRMLRCVTLCNTDIAEYALVVTPAMHSLGIITLRGVTLSYETWCRFVDSLSTISWSVRIYTYALHITPQEQVNTALQYVETNESMFHVVCNAEDIFNFESKK